MHPAWHRVIKTAVDLLPDFNDDLLIHFRDRKISQIKQYLDTVFKESIKIFANSDFKYIGYTVLSPEDRIATLIQNPIFKGSMEIQKSTFEALKFAFEFQSTPYSIYINVPYTEFGRVILSGTDYYPLFPIVERGGLHRSRDKVIIKVMRAPLSFWRKETIAFVADGTIPFKELVITTKIHQRSRRGKRTERTPLMIYPLAQSGFRQTMNTFQFAQDEIDLVATQSDPAFAYVKVNESTYIRLKPSVLEDINKRRVVATLMMIFLDNKKFNIADVLRPTAEYFKVCLGRYTYPSNQNDELLYRNAREHLTMTNTILDPTAQHQLHSIGIDVADIYSLFTEVYYHIDQWLISYKPTDLYDKKIGALDQIMAGLVRDIFNKLFDIINNSHQKKVGLTHQTVNQFVRSASKFSGSWFSGSRVFRPDQSIYNSNRLLTIGAKRFLSLENTETAGRGAQASGHNRVPTALLKSHPSQLLVTSILSIPSSSPCISGDINPFCMIDGDGNIVRPVWAEELEHIFD